MGFAIDRISQTLSTTRQRVASRRAVVGGAAKLAGGGAVALASGAAVTRSAMAAPSWAQDATPSADGTTPNPQMQEVLDELAALSNIPIESQTPFNARQLPGVADAALSLLSKRGEPALAPVASVEHRLIPTPAGDLVARVYTPEGTGPFPVIVYYHGGGWVIADIRTYDSSCRALCTAATAVVVSVAYRQAPENPFPAAVDDAFASYQYVMANAAEFGGDPARVAVAGESAGGNLAAVTCLLASAQGVPLPVHQLLVYPVTTFVPEAEGAETVEQFAMAKPLGAGLLTFFGSLYVPNQADKMSPNASPLLAEELGGLPPATIIAASIDPLLGQGQQYAAALEAAGVDVSYTLYEGVTHEFFGLGALVDDAQTAVTEAAARLTESFSAASGTPTP